MGTAPASYWHEDTKAKMLAWTAEGLNTRDIWERLDDSHTLKAVRAKLYDMLLTPEKKRLAAQAKRERDQQYRINTPRIKNSQPVHRPTPEMLRERDQRVALPPRDLTAAFCGDPPPGYSALERRA